MNHTILFSNCWYMFNIDHKKAGHWNVKINVYALATIKNNVKHLSNVSVKVCDVFKKNC